MIRYPHGHTKTRLRYRMLLRRAATSWFSSAEVERGYWVEVVKVAPERGLESVCPRLTGEKFLSTSKAVRFHNSRYSPLKPAEDLHFDSSNEKEISLVDFNRASAAKARQDKVPQPPRTPPHTPPKGDRAQDLNLPTGAAATRSS
ncbi:hypothetical protein B0H13DRAFT_1855446 [Mycena leptocephala]|nr:hypothetical protein B0H13DRAFT_1855446 [Mycena leptocephala]